MVILLHSPRMNQLIVSGILLLKTNIRPRRHCIISNHYQAKRPVRLGHTQVITATLNYEIKLIIDESLINKKPFELAFDWWYKW